MKGKFFRGVPPGNNSYQFRIPWTVTPPDAPLLRILVIFQGGNRNKV